MKGVLICLILGVTLNGYANAGVQIEAIQLQDSNVNRAARNFEGQVWTRDSSINTTLGASSISYCKVEDPLGNVLFDSFGPCRIELPRVLDSHHGTWKLFVADSVKIALEEITVPVSVVTESTKPTVTTNVVAAKPLVTLTCSLPTGYDVKACKFRDPAGNIMINHKNGLTDGRYEVGVTDSPNSCSLVLTQQETSDLGLWRCGMETDNDVFYGFMTVLCPWAMQDPTVAASVVTDPILSAQKTTIAAVTDDLVTLFCSVPSPIQYCYFRARNGTIFNVGTEQNSRNAEYFGSGLESGECGIRFPAQLSDAGAWSCHVGFFEADMEEQRLPIILEVNDLMVAEQYVSGSTLVIESRVHNSRALDVCRFVRIDGFGFTSNHVLPERYSSYSSLSNGHCALHIVDPNILDHHPWTVVAMIKGLGQEVSRYTDHTIAPGTPGHHETEDGNDEDGVLYGPRPGYMEIPHGCFWFGVVLFIFFFITTMVLIIPTSRKWVLRKSTSVRMSIRKDSVEKPPLPVYDQPINNAALPA